jgi:hypothetical protein
VASVPVDDEPGQVERGVVAGLPAGVRRQRADQLDAMVVGRRKDLPDADITRVDQVVSGSRSRAARSWWRPGTVSRSEVDASWWPHG